MTVGPLSRIIGPNWVKYNTNEGKILHPRTMASEKMATFSHFVHHVTNEEAKFARSTSKAHMRVINIMDTCQVGTVLTLDTC